MSEIIKHSFEAVSLLTTDNGMLDVTMIPAMNQPDWIIPTSLILSVEAHTERTSSYLWQQQSVAVFHLLPSEQAADKVIILEGNTVLHRIALQTVGELRQTKLRIAEVRDIDTPKLYEESSHDLNMNIETLDENIVLSYLFQTVIINDMIYLIPDLDKIAHQLVNLTN